jgi:hypothetical protein
MNSRKFNRETIFALAGMLALFVYGTVELLGDDMPIQLKAFIVALVTCAVSFVLTTRLIAWYKRMHMSATTQLPQPPMPPPEAIRAGIPIGPKYPSPLSAQAIPPFDVA